MASEPNGTRQMIQTDPALTERLRAELPGIRATRVLYEHAAHEWLRIRERERERTRENATNAAAGVAAADPPQ